MSKSEDRPPPVPDKDVPVNSTSMNHRPVVPDKDMPVNSKRMNDLPPEYAPPVPPKDTRVKKKSTRSRRYLPNTLSASDAAVFGDRTLRSVQDAGTKACMLS